MLRAWNDASLPGGQARPTFTKIMEWLMLNFPLPAAGAVSVS
jgi:hypothetical protein